MDGRFEEALIDPAWEVFANIRAGLMAMGEEEALIKEANEGMLYINQESEFDNV